MKPVSSVKMDGQKISTGAGLFFVRQRRGCGGGVGICSCDVKNSRCCMRGFLYNKMDGNPPGGRTNVRAGFGKCHILDKIPYYGYS